MGKMHFDEIVAGIFMILTVIVVILNISMRYFFNSPIQSAEEIATICFIWSVFIGGGGCFRKKMHMGIDIFTQLLPIKYKNGILFIMNFLVCLIAMTFLYLSFKFSWVSRMKPTAVLGISSIYVNFSLVISFGLVVIYSFRDIWLSVKKLGGKG